MKVRFKGHGLVDVLDADCRTRTCFAFGLDKGAFTQGRGYTSYHKEPRKVCLRRHTRGCPHPLICLDCRSLQVEGRTVCSWCKSKSLGPYGEGNGEA